MVLQLSMFLEIFQMQLSNEMAIIPTMVLEHLIPNLKDSLMILTREHTATYSSGRRRNTCQYVTNSTHLRVEGLPGHFDIKDHFTCIFANVVLC